MVKRDNIVAAAILIGAVLLPGCPWPSQRSAPATHAVSMGERGDHSLPSEQATAALPAEPTLEDCLKLAAANNAGLRAAFERWKAALEEIPQARSLPDPMFSYDYFISEVETRVGSQRQAMAISQKFPWLMKLVYRDGIAAQTARVRQREYQAAKLRVFYRIKDAWYECYYLGRAITITDENFRLIKHVEEVARARYRAAAGSHPDVIRLQVELGKLDDRLRSLRRLQQPLVARLNATMNRPPNAPLKLPTACDDESAEFDEAALLADMAGKNPELQALDDRMERQRLGIRLARQAYFPDVAVGARYIDVQPSTGGRHPSDDGQDALAVGVSVNVPIWWESYAAGVRQAEAKYRAARHNRTERRNTLTAELLMAAYQVRDTERKIDLYRDTLVPKARQALRTTEAGYRAGKSTYSDLIDAQRVMLEFELAAERALTDHAQVLARLETLAGQDLPRRPLRPATAQPAEKAKETHP